MGPVADLEDLYRHASARLDRLKLLGLAAFPMPFPERDRRLCYVAIEAVNGWSEFVRAYVLSCVLHPHRIKNPRVTLSNKTMRSFADVLHAAVRLMKGSTRQAPKTRRDEPAWHDVRTLMKTCAYMGCSHIADVHRALSIPTMAFEHLPTFRNYYAHRNPESKQRACDLAAKYAIPSVAHPTFLAATAAPGRPQPLLADWIDDLRNAAELLCE
jgi:hypothetical protein